MPKIIDREQYRKQLLHKSFDLLAEKSYSKITMREIAKGLAVSTGTLYHYFPSKESLFLQLVEEITQRDISLFLAEVEPNLSLKHRIEALIDYVEKYQDYFFKQNLLFIDFYQHQRLNGGLDMEILQDVWEKTRQAIAEYLEISDMAKIDFMLTFFDGLLFGKLYEGKCASFSEQTSLLKRLMTYELALIN
ncbi:TetR/AcrR family transcriptional regulator [Tumidithrix elongata RA019]|uniref:TetR/AcrR family transcriptional regulator n=1 Tax=Tumidithrix elongata BACA0141 TaxID=2716417 RepID=A0AAW9PYP6_9CYAN|nr:TetR/AcrR family transcriptional regulator [Tumidithrix elongata RA019]